MGSTSVPLLMTKTAQVPPTIFGERLTNGSCMNIKPTRSSLFYRRLYPYRLNKDTPKPDTHQGEDDVSDTDDPSILNVYSTSRILGSEDSELILKLQKCVCSQTKYTHPLNNSAA